jgi:hypothetical protein
VFPSSFEAFPWSTSPGRQGPVGRSRFAVACHCGEFLRCCVWRLLCSSLQYLTGLCQYRISLPQVGYCNLDFLRRLETPHLSVDPSTNGITVVIKSSSAKLPIWCFGLGFCVRVVVDRASYCLSCSGSLNAFLCFKCILLVLYRGSFLSFFRRFCGSREIFGCLHKWFSKFILCTLCSQMSCSWS